MIVVSDTSPLNYLALLGKADVLPALFGQVYVPAKVAEELTAPGSPAPARGLIESRPAWLVVRSVGVVDAALGHLDAGEAEAITLTTEVGASLLLCDER